MLRKPAERCIPRNALAAATDNLASPRFIVYSAFFASSAAWIIPLYTAWMFTSKTEPLYFYPDGLVRGFSLLRRKPKLTFYPANLLPITTGRGYRLN